MGLPVEVNNLMMGSLGGYTIGRSLRFRSSASAYLNRTPASAGSRTTWTWSMWVKRGALGSRQMIFGNSVSGGSSGFFFEFQSNDTIQISDYNSGYVTQLITTQVFRDPSGWYHLIFTYDTSNATSSSRMRLYVNGVQVSAFTTATYPSLNYSGLFNTASQMSIATSGAIAAYYTDCYLAEVNFIDGQALTPSSFGAYDTNGVWQPKKYTGTYGTNGFYLPFSNTTSTTTLVADSSGNSNNWTANNISLTAGTTYDSMIDSPTVSASASNYAVINRLDLGGGSSSSFLVAGNLNFGDTTDGSAGDGNSAGFRSTIGVSSGKWYIEGTKLNATTNQRGFGFGTPTIALGSWNGGSTNNLTTSNDQFIGFDPNQAVAFFKTGSNAATTVASSITTSQNTIYAIALDLDNSQVSFYVNGTQVGSTTSFTKPSATSQYFVTFSQSATWNRPGLSLNFGQRPFTYTPPTGFNALNTYNLPAPSIANGAQYMAATTYTGNGGTAQSISNSGNNTIGTTFQPDLVWIKARSGALSNSIYDSVRGVRKTLSSNATNAEYSESAGVSMTAFNSNGFSVGAENVGIGSVNGASTTYIGWQWLAGGTGVTNTSGTITSTVSANPTAGFSVATFTTQASGTGTVGHGLGVAPDMIIIKLRATVNNWRSYHSVLGNTQYMILNSTSAATTDSATWNNTSPTSSVFTLGSYWAGSLTGVAYSFAAVDNYSAFGKYTGSGSADGPFIFTNFRPRFLIAKRTDAAGYDWVMTDSSRAPYNVVTPRLFANTSDAESSATSPYDFLSNGFKLRNTNANENASGGTYIWAAFSENPFKYSRAR